jgi:hypothetical protein
MMFIQQYVDISQVDLGKIPPPKKPVGKFPCPSKKAQDNSKFYAI